ncbi:Glycosyltransferase involved in cell wall bisynthesis [Clostridium cavendishii DSM 21758]|uniref:Glycosyltransferase involved in cell wall bisynthesis n=1 Tax=Clostridium cavendishii DSM 21758 TaxID=1121302 RepID=A0A1M6Q8P7_9CLOT|nr:glycosyltransferase family 4 protein [Clostridium cavendishii]SHK16515.1 Glycosyltransferase involved in cell wall bisynthesis [Clostridium cavendishii DSM 21758]
MKEINIIGIYPPPLGGISVHIKRVKELLDSKAIKCVVFNEGDYTDLENNIIPLDRYGKFMFKSLKIRNSILHFHSTTAKIRSIIWLFKKLTNNKVIITIHGDSLLEQLENSNGIIKKGILKTLRDVDKIIVVNDKYSFILPRYGIDENKIEYIIAYVKPILNPEVFNNINNRVLEFMDEGGVNLLTNGNVRFHNGQDLYGFDLLIEVVNKLVKSNINVKLTIAVLAKDKQDEDEKKYYKELKDLVIKYGIGNNVLFYEVDNAELYPLLSKSDIFIRATNTDGDPLSLREAIDFNVPSIASDIIKRPDEVITFKNRSVDDLYEKMIRLINNLEIEKEKLINNHNKKCSSSEQLLNIYNSLINELYNN